MALLREILAELSADLRPSVESVLTLEPVATRLTDAVLAHHDYCTLLQNLSSQRSVLQRDLKEFNRTVETWKEWYRDASTEYAAMRAEVDRYRSVYGDLDIEVFENEGVHDSVSDDTFDPSGSELAEAMDDLSSMIGLERVKAAVRELSASVAIDRIRRSMGLRVVNQSLHLVFSGSPGTGKTEVARLLGRIYKALGVTRRADIIEVSRADLVGQFVGATALKVKDTVERALGAILFIDEAYALSRCAGVGHDFGQEAIDTLVKLMEDHREDLVVIVAGYTDEMDAFLQSNPGLRSRFRTTLHFDDYTVDELIDIFRRFCANSDYVLTGQGEITLRRLFERTKCIQGAAFGNGRAARQAFEIATATLAARITTLGTTSIEALTNIEAEDFQVPFTDDAANHDH